MKVAVLLVMFRLFLFMLRIVVQSAELYPTQRMLGFADG
jgi:hypothetical protein